MSKEYFCVECKSKLVKEKHPPYLFHKFQDGILLCDNRECYKYRVIVCYYKE